MKKLLTLALVLSSASAFATRARVTALGNSAHLTDASYIYSKPSYAAIVGDSLTLESGLTANNFATSDTVAPIVAAPNAVDRSDINAGAEGLLIRSMGDAKFAIGLGHDDATTFMNRGMANVIAVNAALGYAIRSQQNPLFLAYATKMGDMNVGAGLRYSNFDDKKGDEKESTMGLTFDARGDKWNVELDLGLTDEWKTGATNASPGDSFKGKSAIALTGGYNVTDSLYVNAGFMSGGFKMEDNSVEKADVEYTNINAGVTESIKKDGTEFFYGAGLLSTSAKEKTNDSKVTSLKMPLIIGLEAEANSWLVIRGSVTQNLLLVDNDKTTKGATTAVETAPGANSTKLAAGAGLKFNKLTVDGSLFKAVGGSQTINSGNLLANVGLTYAF